MGKSSYAELNLVDQMAKKPENAMNLLYQLGKTCSRASEREIVDIQALIDAQKAASNSHLGIGISMQNKYVKQNLI